MKLESKYFDMIRIRNKASDSARPDPNAVPGCQWKGCAEPGPHRAPKGRGLDGHFFAFCQEHARQYNASYNYFDGMSNTEVEEFRKDAITGHRPTWKAGANAWSHGTRKRAAPADVKQFAETRQAGVRGFYAWRAQRNANERPEPVKRTLKPLERKSYDALGLKDDAGPEEIKARYKQLVKQHHPDSNGGDRGSEDKLRAIIQAYNHLKQVGLA